MYPEPERRAPFGPEVSWPTGYSDLEYRDGDYRYGAQQAAPQQPAQPPAVAASAVGEHPYAAFTAAGYGDDGYRDPGYQGPAAQDMGVPGTRTVRGFVEQGQPQGGYLRDGYPGPGHPSGAYPVQSHTGYREIEIAYPPAGPAEEAYHGADSYKQPWDYGQPLRYGDEEVYPTGQDGYEQAADYDTGTYQPQAYEPSSYNGSDYSGSDYRGSEYNGSDYSMPGVGGPGYDLSGIIGTSDFEAIDYDQPGYDRLSYDDPRYSDTPDYRDAGPRFDEQRYDEPRFNETRFSDTRFDVPRFDETRLDNLWLAADDVREESAPVGYGNDGFGGTSVRSEYSEVRPGQSRRFNETRTDLTALSAFEADHTRFDLPAYDETRIDNLRAFSTATDMRPAAAALLAPPAMQPRSWAEDTSLDHFADLDLTDEPLPPAFSRASLATLDNRPEADDDTAARRAGGRRRGRSSDRRQWIALGAIAVVAAGAIGGVLMKYVFPRSTGPAHEVVAAQTVGAYTQSATLEKEMNVSSLAREVGSSSSGQASGVVSAVYQQGAVAPGSNPQIFMFVGGKLASADPSASIANFEQSYPNAHVVSAGSLGGKAACTESKVNGEEAAMCVWFDNDTFGAVVSSTMSTAKLATTLDQVRPSLELYAK